MIIEGDTFVSTKCDTGRCNFYMYKIYMLDKRRADIYNKILSIISAIILTLFIYYISCSPKVIIVTPQ